jgi:hypothetical protein
MGRRGCPVGDAVDDDHGREAVAGLLLGADRAQRVADAVVGAAGLHGAHAAVGRLGPVDRSAARGLKRRPVDGEPVERRLERLEAVAPRREGADVLAVPEEVGIDLGHPDGQAAARRDVGRRRLGRQGLGLRRGRRRLVVVTAASPRGDGGGHQSRRDRAPH